MAEVTFDETAAVRWRRCFGTANHPLALHDRYALEAPAEGGLPRLRDRTVHMPVGLYVVVDGDGHVLYVGKVRRQSGSGIVERLDDHHAARRDWEAVWLLPLRSDCSELAVLRLEAQLIAAYRPRDNVHCAGHRREQVA